MYLAMNSDAEYVEDCLREAWPDIQSDTRIKADNADLESFKHRFHIRKATPGTLSGKFPQQIFGAAAEQKPTRLINLPWLMRFAAAMILLVGSSVLLWDTFKLKPEKAQLAKHPVEIEPGGDKALLALADGKMIKLSDIAVGTTLKLQNGVRVEKTSDGNITYHTGNGPTTSNTAYNTVITPNGGQYRVTLPDGSNAWLNAGSSLNYPLRFASKERRVKMTGEVYFEIAKLSLPHSAGQHGRVPFYVETGRQEIQVLGTHFNVNAYPEEPYIVTTLTEGRVRVKSGNGKSVVLNPGDQALVADDITVKQVDPSGYLAWTTGDFVFKGETLEGVLRKVARWYDVETECPPELGNLRFSGMISRSQPLSTIIDMLETTKKVKVTLNERRLIVRN